MNNYTTPYDASHSLYENINNTIAERDYLRNDNVNLVNANNMLQAACNNIQNQLNAVTAQAQGMHMADVDTINRLTGTIASMKAERELASREFKPDSYGNIYCIEPSRKKREVGYIKIFPKYILCPTINKVEHSNLVVEYDTGISELKTAVIPFEDITEKKFIKHFPSFGIKCQKDIANDCLYNLLMDIIGSNPAVMTIPEYPGIVLNIKDNILVGAEYICREMDLPPEFNNYISSAYKQKYLPSVNKTPSKILRALNEHLTSHDIVMLMNFANYGMLSTYFKSIHFETSDILIVSANSPESEELASLVLKTYDREKPPKSLTMSKYELNNVLKECKDETIVFKDNTVSDSYSKFINSLDTITSFRSDENCKPFNIAIISNEAQYYIPQNRGIFLELDEKFGKDYSSEKRYELSSALNESSRYFAEYFCKHIDEYGPMLINNIQEIKEESKNDFSSNHSCTTFAVLYSVYIIWMAIFNIADTPDFKDYLKKLIMDSQNLETGKDLSIVNSFFKELNKFIAENKLSIKKLGRTMNYERNTDTVIIDSELMLMEESVIKSLFLPDIHDAKTVNSILNALETQGYLVSTNGYRKPTTVYDSEGTPMHINLIAFKYVDMISSDTIKYIDSLSSKQYFTDKNDIPDFLPLIQNVFGHKAGQLLKYNENQHRCITGKSGSGKTVFLTQLMARLTHFGNRVVVFDSSNSFSETELEGKLSKKFIEEHITLYDASKSGLPVHLLYGYEDDSYTKQKNMIANIISAALNNPTLNQISFLKKKLDKYIRKFYCDYEEFYNMLILEDDEISLTEKVVKNSVIDKLEHVLEEIIENYSDDNKNDWFEFLNNCKDIVIIKIEEAGGKNGNQITDMLLASLFYDQIHKDKNERCQLSIFIDEIQNQNLSDGSIISKIMREGRRYSIDLNIATQYISNINESHILRQAGLNICFRPDITSRNALADMLGFKKKDIWKLDNMSTGECFIQGSIVNFETEGRDATVIRGKTLLISDSPLLTN